MIDIINSTVHYIWVPLCFAWVILTNLGKTIAFVIRLLVVMTSSNGNCFCVTGPLCGEFNGHRWIPLTKASDAELWCFLWSAHWISGWVNNREAGDLRHNRAYEVIVMYVKKLIIQQILIVSRPQNDKLAQHPVLAELYGRNFATVLTR